MYRCFYSNFIQFCRFHSRHLNPKIPDSNAFDEMICNSCTLKNDFLNYYSGYCIPINDDTNASINNSDDLDVTTDTDKDANNSVVKETSTPDTEKKVNAEIDQCIQDIIEINKSNVQSENSTSKRSADNDTTHNIPISKKAKLDEGASSSSDICRKPPIALTKLTGASFWPLEWRTKLCKCSICLDMYKKNNVEFLLDEEDTVDAYQQKGKAKAENRTTSVQDETMRAISGMDHVTQIEAILAYNKLKKKLTDFLTTFVSTEQVITAKDVDSFFQNEKTNAKKD